MNQYLTPSPPLGVQRCCRFIERRREFLDARRAARSLTRHASSTCVAGEHSRESLPAMGTAQSDDFDGFDDVPYPAGSMGPVLITEELRRISR